MKLSKKILIPSLTGTALLGITVLALSLNALSSRGRVEVENTRTVMMAEKTDKLRNIVETAYTAIKAIDQNQSLTKPERLERAKALVKAMRYNEADYLWINDTAPRMVMHPFKPALDGKALNDFKDPDGKRLFVAMAEVCKQKGAGTVDYLWPKPGKDKPVAKLSYVKLYEPWDQGNRK